MNLRSMIDLLIEVWEKRGDDFIIKGWYDAEEYFISEIELNSDTIYLTFDKEE